MIRNSLDESPIHRLDETALGLSDGVLVDDFRLSPGGRRLAFTVSEGGSRFLELRVLDLERSELLDDRILDLKFGMPHWTADGEHLVYWRYPRQSTSAIPCSRTGKRPWAAAWSAPTAAT